MGLVLNLLKKKDVMDVYIDFENAKPQSAEEKQVYAMIDKVLKKGQEVTKIIEDYKGCSTLVQTAVRTPSPENEANAFKALLAVVDSIAAFYQYSKTLEDAFPVLLDTLARPVGESKESKEAKEAKDSKTSLESQQALVKQLADVFDFALHFDQIRMLRPTLSNDFSYYRRLLPKFANSTDMEVKVKDEQTGGIALFTAQHIPMMQSLCTATQKALKQNEHVTVALATMANACYSLLERKKFEKKETNLFIARAMTGSIVLYDHVATDGVFCKKSPVNIKSVVTLLKKNFPDDTSMLNAIQFSTRTFRQAPDSIIALFEN